MAEEIALKERVERLEDILAEVIQGLKEMKYRIEEQERRFNEEMRQMKEEFKEEMRQMKERMEERDRKFDEDLRKSREEYNKKWGDLARKMGTIVEDIIIPGIEDAVKKRFNEIVIKLMPRVVIKNEHGRKIVEFDTIVETRNKVYVIEVKSKPDAEWIREAKKKVEIYKELHPEERREVVGVFGSLYIEEDVIKYATREGIYVVGMKGEYLQFLN